MAIEIIKPGRKQFRTECRGCGCEFNYEIGDVQNSLLGRKEGGTIHCPSCNSRCTHHGADCGPDKPTWESGQ